VGAGVVCPYAIEAASIATMNTIVLRMKVSRY
jgi:hypothetical protein